MGTRPDIAQAVNYFSQFSDRHDNQQLKVVRRVQGVSEGPLVVVQFTVENNGN